MASWARWALPLGVVGGGFFLALLSGGSSFPVLGVEEVHRRFPELEERSVSVKGILVHHEGNLFLLSDGSFTLPVLWSENRPIPGISEGWNLSGRSLLFRGVLRNSSEGIYLEAHDLVVGCPSKYSPLLP